jgi:hypothetical protein
MVTYTVFDPNDSSNIYGQNLTAIQAMEELLTYDGYAFEIREESWQGSTIWQLYHSDGSANSTRSARHLQKTVVFSLKKDKQQAHEEIALAVITANWPRLPEVMSDDDFEAYKAQLSALHDE